MSLNRVLDAALGSGRPAPQVSPDTPGVFNADPNARQLDPQLHQSPMKAKALARLRRRKGNK